MPKRPNFESPLVAAAIAFDDERATYDRLAELLLESPLATAKHLERANLTIEQIGATEERLSATGQQLAQAIAAARDCQQQLGRIATATRELNAATSGGQAAVQEVEERVTALAAGFEEIASQAHAVHQQLVAAGRKLHSVTSKMS